MIFDLIINFFIGIGTFILSLFPTFNTNADINVTGLTGVLNVASCIVPVKTMFVALGIWFTLANIDFTISVINWFIRKIPTID